MSSLRCGFNDNILELNFGIFFFPLRPSHYDAFLSRCLSCLWTAAAMVSNSQCQFLTWVRKASRSRKQNHLDHYQQKAFEIEKDFNYSSSSISSEGTERQSLDRNHQHISSPAKISLARLIANDAAEADRLLLACRELGGFYLDLTAADLGEDVMSDADRLFGLGRDVFNLPEDEKREYDMVKFGGYYG